MVVELWLVWSLFSGKITDADSFLSKDQCEQALLASLKRLDESKAAAKASGAPKEVTDQLDSITFYGCTPARAEFKTSGS